MLDKCAEACARQAEVDAEHAVKIESKIAHIETFFDLEAEDIEKNVISFDKFKVGSSLRDATFRCPTFAKLVLYPLHRQGQVTVITNVASYCGENAIGVV